MMAKTNHWGALAAAAGTLVAVGLLLLIMVVVLYAQPAEAKYLQVEYESPSRPVDAERPGRPLSTRPPSRRSGAA